MDTQKLRQRILDLAIRGKLVPQDPNDEPASVLLERIRAEKERLIAEGKIKRPKAKKSTDKSHYQNFTPPFPIPASWQWVRLGEIGLWQSGATPSKSNPNYFGKGFPWLNTGDLNDWYINSIPKEITPLALNETSVKLNPKGSVLIAMYGATIGKLGILNIDATTNQACCACYKYWINQLYLFYFLLAWRDNFIAMGDGGAQSNISKEKIESTLMPLPPLYEQHRIVSSIQAYLRILNSIESNKETLTDRIAKAKSKILDLAMQGKLVPQDPADEPAADMLRRVNPKAKIITDNPHYPQLPDNWVYLSLSDINTYKSSTVTPANMPEQLFDLYSVPIFSTLTPENIHGGEIGSAKQVINKGDVLLCKINPHLNRVWEIIEDSHNVQIASSEWIVVRSELHHPSFLKWYFNSPEFRALLSSQVSGVGGSLTRAQPAIVKGYLVPVPPMEEQKRISSAIELWLDCLDSISLSLTN
ncbi:restriction endonuclease subunit S [Muribaculaceae bacterium Isolate-004 (NCI)]|nr:restriction endonuclease subunit S [Muribaculaceae bacterium Isolate-004 (NCI)]